MLASPRGFSQSLAATPRRRGGSMRSSPLTSVWRTDTQGRPLREGPRDGSIGSAEPILDAAPRAVLHRRVPGPAAPAARYHGPAAVSASPVGEDVRGDRCGGRARGGGGRGGGAPRRGGGRRGRGG